ncbi:MAG: hypothetical protein R2810_05115 [Flavobacteriales bacterium]
MLKAEREAMNLTTNEKPNSITMRPTNLLLIAALLVAQGASAFCGFYVAKADATLFNDRLKRSSCATAGAASSP